MDRIQFAVEILRESLTNVPGNRSYVTHDQKNLIIRLPDDSMLIIAGNYEGFEEEDLNEIENTFFEMHK